MSTERKDEATEVQIKNTAKRLFFGEGKFNATTQEIADAAGVNRTLINYYFRSRDKLFDLVFKDAQEYEQKRTESIMFSELPFKAKIEEFIDESFLMAKEYPYMELYMVTQFNQGCYFKDEEGMDRMLKKFYEEFEVAMEEGLILKMEPIQFIINMISLISFPVAMRPLFQKTMHLDDKEYERILTDRKQIIMDTLFCK
ncbi:AcrR family transcriptional regulator [Flavobacterium arsenatis]|uniref:AcrR family transcriptional regulator n=1 Tax=Flavobacterium arsenatis TaxID=1484332 RepID=A0ABU1TL84_9FLAO|nr:TetR/AcrR family transcriptional regulator [Flavobacterium arsenatis]MDR6966736.1 AcrR family transcriptional regulator [Flavobacterium arsenatis]